MSKYIELCGTKEKDQILKRIKNVNKLKDLIDDPEVVCYAASIALSMHNVTPTQMRRFYGYVKGIEQVNRALDDNKKEFQQKARLKLLQPKIAGSSERKELIVLYEVVKACVEDGKIDDVGDLRAFVAFFEAILDYHSTIERNKKKNEE